MIISFCLCLRARVYTTFNMSLMACFADINVSQGSVATYASYGGMFNINFNCKFTKESFSEKKL